LIQLLTEGRVSNNFGAATVLQALSPGAMRMMAHRRYDSDWFPQALSEKEIANCIFGRSSHKAPNTCDAGFYKQRNLFERMFGGLKNWRRIATQYDRCAHIFMSAICIAGSVIFWL
jgi:transposase